MKIRPVGSEFFQDGWMDGEADGQIDRQTDRRKYGYDEEKIRFLQFCERA